ncbi:hypothetical protein PybrP1_004721 [[Pythium] brassicae (nom. inval.)]|nr:hypothetical protein PybrP1_004721 [[Pythium] brassicae (nom. inval.)]
MSAVDDAITPKLVPGSKELQVVCGTCTFINAADATVCAMCGAEVKPPTHDVQANGLWKCGSCATTNRKGAKACVRCKAPLVSVVTSAAPSQIFCPHCGFLNDGGNHACVQCDATIRSTLAKLGADLRDSTNFLARDMGVNINVKCPGCAAVCVVPPATACLRCGTCHTYFASPSVGDATNFHVARLASSLSSSLLGLFNHKPPPAAHHGAPNDDDDDAPVGKLLALGDQLPRSPLRAGRTRSSSASFRSSESEPPALASSRRAQKEQDEAARAREFARQEQAFENMHTAQYPMAAAPIESPAAAVPVVAPAGGGSRRGATAATRATPQDLIQVEGEIVEL